MTVSLAPMQLTWRGQKGIPLLLIHGWGMNGEVFNDFANKLEVQGYRVGVVDLPGFGHSPAWPELTLEAMVDELAKQLEGTPDVVVLGWSLGGLVATKLAIEHPQLVSQLITVASTPKFVADEDWPGIKPKVLSGFAQALSDDINATLDRFIALQAMGSDTARQDIKALRLRLADSPDPHPKALVDGLLLLQQVDLRSQLTEIKAPWLQIEGRLDALVPARGQGQRQHAAPSAERVVLEKASHAPFISHPQQVIESISAFIRR